MSLQTAKNEALSLSPMEKIKLIESIMETLERPDPEIEEQLINESDRRFELYKQGKVKPIPGEEVFREYGL